MAFFLGLLFSAVGSGYFLYGKKQQDVPCLIAGVVLMIYPYFFSSAGAIIVIGVVIVAIPIAIAKGVF